MGERQNEKKDGRKIEKTEKECEKRESEKVGQRMMRKKDGEGG